MGERYTVEGEGHYSLFPRERSIYLSNEMKTDEHFC